MTAPATPGALAGVRILDLTSVVMGPYATQILGDLGAEVISVEEAGGDTNRIMGPGPEPGLTGVAMNLLRNKRNVCLDLKHPGGRDAFLRIAATCDVYVTNLRPAPLARLGLDYAAISAVRPDIVMVQAHGWPSDGPDANKPAYDDVIQAGSGIAHTFQLQSGTPALAPTLVASGTAIADGVNLARRLVNMPPDDLYPETFAAEAATIAGRGAAIGVSATATALSALLFLNPAAVRGPAADSAAARSDAPREVALSADGEAEEPPESDDVPEWLLAAVALEADGDGRVREN
jgi:hypothetical protein